MSPFGDVVRHGAVQDSTPESAQDLAQDPTHKPTPAGEEGEGRSPNDTRGSPFPQRIDGWFFRRAGLDGQGVRVVWFPDKDQDTVATTEAITRYEGRHIWTADGSEYVLGEVNEFFARRMENQGFPFDPENPLRGDERGFVPVVGPNSPDDDPDNSYHDLFPRKIKDGNEPEPTK